MPHVSTSKYSRDAIIEWKMVYNKELSPRDLRANYIVGHGVFIEAAGLVGRHLRNEFKDEWPNYLQKLSHFDWSRSNTADWLGRAFNQNGRIQKNATTIQLTSNKIKQLLKLPLSETEQNLENKFFKGGA